MTKVLTFSTLFPNSIRPGHGIFVETRLRELVSSGKIESRVIAPVPWFFSTHSRFGEYARMARVPKSEIRFGLEVLHPRYFLPPKVGMNVAPFLLALGALESIRRLIDQGFDFEVIDSHYYYPDGVAAALLAWHFKRPFTVTARGSDINLISEHRIPLMLMKWASKFASASIGVSKALTEKMEEMGFPATSLHTMPNGVDLKRFSIIPREEARHALNWLNQPTLLSVGNLVENKGHHFVIKALVHLPEFRLVIVGEGPERKALQMLADGLNLKSRVEFIGQIAQKELPKFYCAADVLVHASSREGWPNVLLESLAGGTPVAATRVGGIAEIVSVPAAGKLFMTQSVEEIVKTIREVWASRSTQVVVRKTIEWCSWQSTTDAQIELFASIENTRKRGFNA
jgi:teichuronic acid biosynthesis glycosyltransferase TuaC